MLSWNGSKTFRVEMFQPPDRLQPPWRRRIEPAGTQFCALDLEPIIGLVVGASFCRKSMNCTSKYRFPVKLPIQQRLETVNNSTCTSHLFVFFSTSLGPLGWSRYFQANSWSMMVNAEWDLNYHMFHMLSITSNQGTKNISAIYTVPIITVMIIYINL